MEPQFAEQDEIAVSRGPVFVAGGGSELQKTSFGYSIDEKERQVRVQFTGKLTFDVIAKYAEDLGANPLFDPSYAELVDLRLIETITLNAQELIKLADEVDPFKPKSKRAFVAQSENQIHAARVHQLLRPDGSGTRVFISFREAKQWLRDE